MQPTHPHHVAALLVVGVGVEQVVAHVFKNGLDGGARHFGHSGIRVGGGRHVHQPFTGDGLAGQQAGAPAKAGRKRQVCALNFHHGIQQKLVARAIEVATAVERALGDGQGFCQLGGVGCAYLGNQRRHLGVGWQHVGKHGQELVAEVADTLVLDLKVQHGQKLAVRARVGDDGLARLVAHDAGHGHAVVGVAAHDGVDAGHAAGHFQVHVHAVVRQHHHYLGAFGTGLVHHGLHVFVLNAKGPVRHHVARVGNRGVGKGLADDGAGHAIDFTDHIGLEDLVAKVIGLDVLGDKVHLAGKVFFNNFLHPLHAVGEFPVAGHHVHAQQLAGVHHVLSIGPQRGARALPGVTAIEQQRAGAAGLEALDQRCQMRKAAHLAVAARGFFKVEVRQRMGLCGARPHLGCAQQMLTHQVGQIAAHGAYAQIDVGLAKVHRHELRVAVGHVQKRHIAKGRNVVQAVGCGGGIRVRKRAHAHAGHGARTQHLEKLTFG